jgi:hypothetical protein
VQLSQVAGSSRQATSNIPAALTPHVNHDDEGSSTNSVEPKSIIEVAISLQATDIPNGTA